MNLELNYPEELKQDISKLRSELAEIKLNLQPKEPDKYIGRKELAEMLNVNISTVHNWTARGILTALQIGGRIYYRRSDIEDAMIKLNK
jgi:excisionase family DNA binding protein